MILTFIFNAICLLLAGAALAEAADAPPAVPGGNDRYALEEEQVVAERDPAVDGPRFLPDVKGVEIYAGKKTEVIQPAEPPKIVNDNYRQVLSRAPGLVIAEETTPLVSIGYRGFDPNRTQYTQVLVDGLPISADMFGYPENYYLPPIDAVDTIDFLHGGAGLLFGPQPGGALNYVTRRPNPAARFSLYTNQTWGSDSFYSTYDEASGTVGRLGYEVYYYQKQGLGFREANSDFGLYSGSAKTVYAIDDRSRITLAFDGYGEEHGEPGGLCRPTDQPNGCGAKPQDLQVDYGTDRDASSRFDDRFRLQRSVGRGIYENEIGPDTLLRVAAWGGNIDRWSRRQPVTFGTLSESPTNTIELQRFWVAGLDARVRRNWAAWGETHTLTGGIEYFHDRSPRTTRTGATPSANTGPLNYESERRTNYGSAFAENRFVFGRLSLVPALRLDTYAQSIDELRNDAKTNPRPLPDGTVPAPLPLADEGQVRFVPLGGFGASYELRRDIEIYGNVSTAYRPEIFAQAVPTGYVVPRNLDPSTSWQSEIGLRGRPFPWISWDASLFWIQVQDEIGIVGNNVLANAGRARRAGGEIAAEVGLLGLVDHLRGSDLVTRFGDVAFWTSLMLLDARYTAGPYAGRTPRYAPDSLLRSGIQYALPGILKASLLSTASASQYGNDSNDPDWFIPAYNVWDLTFEANVWRETAALYFGVNNVFDEDYWSRVTGSGIDPAYGRNVYGGLRIRL